MDVAGLSMVLINQGSDETLLQLFTKSAICPALNVGLEKSVSLPLTLTWGLTVSSTV